MMFRIFLIAILILSPLLSVQADEKKMDPTGLWARDNKHYVFDVRYCDEDKKSLCADLVKVHPEKKRLAQKYVGQTLVTGLKQRSAASWRGVFSFRKYRVSAWVKMLDANTAKAGGCVFLFLCDEYTLKRQKG